MILDVCICEVWMVYFTWGDTMFDTNQEKIYHICATLPLQDVGNWSRPRSLSKRLRMMTILSCFIVIREVVINIHKGGGSLCMYVFFLHFLRRDLFS